MEVRYRVTGHVIYDDDYMISGTPKLQFNRYDVVGHTECGVRIRLSYNKTVFQLERWRDDTARVRRRKYWPTKEEALESFVRRQMLRIQLLDRQLDSAKRLLQHAKEMKGHTND